MFQPYRDLFELWKPKSKTSSYNSKTKQNKFWKSKCNVGFRGLKSQTSNEEKGLEKKSEKVRYL